MPPCHALAPEMIARLRHIIVDAASRLVQTQESYVGKPAFDTIGQHIQTLQDIATTLETQELILLTTGVVQEAVTTIQTITAEMGNATTTLKQVSTVLDVAAAFVTFASAVLTRSPKAIVDTGKAFLVTARAANKAP